MYSLASISLSTNQRVKEECACCKGRKNIPGLIKRQRKKHELQKQEEAECSDCICSTCYRTLVIDFLISLKAKTKAL